MKLKYLLTAVLASSFAFVGCDDDTVGYLDDIQLSETYLSISTKGGTATVTVESSVDWEFVTDDNWPNVIKRNKDGSIKSEEPAWLAVDKMSGKAGKEVLTFSAAASEGGREFELTIKAGANKQFLRVRQGSLAAVEVTCKEANETAVGKNVRVKGTCTTIENTTFGNWYLTDKTGSLYIYGTLDKKGAKKNFASLGLEIGDVVEIEGPVGEYGGKKQLVDVTVISIKKSLMKVMTPSVDVPKTASDVTVKVAYKGRGVFVTLPEDCSWLTFKGMTYKKGEPTKIDANPADTAIVAFSAVANEGAAERVAEVKFSSSDAKQSSEGTCKITQAPAAYFVENFKSSKGDFTINDVKLPEGSTYVWTHDASKGYMKASSFVGGKNLESESWLISPEIDLTKIKAATLSFEHAMNFVRSDNVTDHIFIYAKKAADADWTLLTVPTYPDGKSWTFVESGDIDLKNFVGSKMQIAFKYVGSTTVAPTYEVRNLIIK